MADVVVPSDPAVKDPTDAALPAAINQAIADLNSNVQTLIDQGVPNGSFELDLETSGEPDGWTLTDNSGGTHTLASTLASTVGHGVRALKCVTTSGGWVEVQNDEYQLVQPGERVQLEFATRVTDATVRVRGQVQLYDSGKTLISTNDVYDENTGNPTASFKKFGGGERQLAVTATGDARFYRVKLIAGESGGSVPADVYFDNVRSRIYHGLVPYGRTSKGAINTDTTTTVDISGQIGNDGTALLAQVHLDLAYVDGAATFTVQGWVGGAWATVAAISPAAAGGGDVVLMVPLNDSSQFRIVSTGTGGGDSVNVYLAGAYGV